MSARPTIPRRSAIRILAAAAAFVVVLASLVGAAQAQDDVEDLRREREETRREAAEAAAALDALSAEDRDLVEALAALDAHIELQESKVVAAEGAIEAAELRAGEAAEAAAILAGEMDGIRLRLRDRVVDAFVGTGVDDAEQLDNSDLLASAVRRYLLDQVVDDEVDVVDELRAAEAARREAERIAEESAAEAERERTDLGARLAELETSRAEAEELRAEVQGRISEWEATATVMAQADADISEEIRRLEEEAARAAAEEARRRADEEAAAAAAAAEAAEAEEADESGAEGTESDESEEADGTETDEVVAPPSDGSFAITHRPVPGGWSSGFGPRIHPIFGTSRMHYGIDFHGGSGDPISAAASGTVLTAGWMNGYGYTAVISHGNGYTTLYAHQSSLLVSSGETVTGGELIGYVGSTGWSTGPHLHFEVRIDGTAVDPDPYLP